MIAVTEYCYMLFIQMSCFNFESLFKIPTIFLGKSNGIFLSGEAQHHVGQGITPKRQKQLLNTTVTSLGVNIRGCVCKDVKRVRVKTFEANV